MNKAVLDCTLNLYNWKLVLTVLGASKVTLFGNGEDARFVSRLG